MRKNEVPAVSLVLIACFFLLAGCAAPAFPNSPPIASPAVPRPPAQAESTLTPSQLTLPAVSQITPPTGTPIPTPTSTSEPLPSLDDLKQRFTGEVQPLMVKLQAALKGPTAGINIQPDDPVIFVPRTERLYKVQSILGLTLPINPNSARQVYVLYDVLRGIDLAWEPKQYIYLQGRADTQAVVTTLWLIVEEGGQYALVQRVDGAGGEGSTSYEQLVTKSVLPLDKLPASLQFQVERNLEEIIEYACGLDTYPELDITRRAITLSLTLESNDWADKKQGLEALGALPSLPASLSPYLLSHVSDERYSYEVRELLKKMGADQGVFAQAVQDATSPDAGMREEAARLLGTTQGDPAQAASVLGKLAADPNSQVRTAANVAMIDLGAPAVETLIALLKNPDTEVRQQAAYDLGEIKDPRAIQPLIDFIHVESDYSAKDSATLALSRFGSAVVEPLIGMLKESNERTREFSAEALGLTGDTRAVQPLIAALSDANANVRRNAALSLAKLGDTSAVLPIAALLRDQDQWVRENAIDALIQFKDARAVTPLISTLNDKEYRTREYASNALVEIGEPSVEPLIVTLGSGNDNIRFWAASALDRLNDPRAVDPLLGRLKSGDQQVVAGAYRFFINRGEPSSESALIKALEMRNDQLVANDFLNSGNDILAQAARDWAKKHNYSIHSSPNISGGPVWGSKR